MARVIQTTVYTFDELTDPKAKERAREWWRNAETFDGSEYFDDFRAVASRLGITISQSDKNDIFWSGFSSQGDGASFAGTYQYAKGAAKAIRAYAPQDAGLHRIADGLTALQRRHAYRLTAGIRAGRGTYVHSRTMEIDVEYADWGEADALRELLRDFADWMYRQLEQAYDDAMSDEAVDETLLLNDYTFTASGERFG